MRWGNRPGDSKQPQDKTSPAKGPADAGTPDAAVIAAQLARRRVIIIATVILVVVVGISAVLFFGNVARGPNPIVVMETSMGTIRIELYEDKAPITVKNFLAYVDKEFYDGTIFHRVIKDFMVQGGGFLPGMKEKDEWGKAIKNESYNGLRNKRETLAMARTKDPDSARAQFFINVKDNDFLDRAKAQDGVGYAVFGRVTHGMDVVDKIRVVKTGHGDVPVEDVIVRSIRRE